MAERKPRHESWHSWTERQIRDAQREGQFDRLRGEGKPIPGLGGGYDPLWWVKQLIEREQLSVLPASLSIKTKVEEELAAIGRLEREGEVRLRLEALNEEIARVNRTTISGPATTVALLDVDAIVAEWRRAGRRKPT
jgi:Domain of unknown function (DUF1992)